MAWIAQSAKEPATGWTVQGSNPGWSKDFHAIQTSCKVHPASSTMGIGSFLGVRQLEPGNDHHLLLAPRLRMGRNLQCLHRNVTCVLYLICTGTFLQCYASKMVTTGPGSLQPYTRIVPKVSVLIFYLNVYWTHLKLQVISFKVQLLGGYTVVPFFPLMTVPKVIFRRCV